MENIDYYIYNINRLDKHLKKCYILLLQCLTKMEKYTKMNLK